MTTTRSAASKENELSNFMNKCSTNFENLDKKLINIQNNNTKIQEDLSKMKDEIIKNLMDSNKSLQERVEKLEKKVQKMEKLENQQQKIITSVESMNQYGRRNNLELSGIPNDVNDDELEGKVKQILEKINVKVKKNDIEACHRLPPTKKNKNKKTIVRFVNRRTAETCLKNKKKLSEIDMSELGFHEDTKIFASENLNEYFRDLAWRCRSLKREKLIHGFKYQNEAFFIKIKESSSDKLKITQKEELFYHFFDFFFPDGPEEDINIL